MDIAKFTISQWYLLIILLGTLMIIAKKKRIVLRVGNRVVYSENALMLTICVLIMVGLAAQRTGIGDTANYINIFRRVPNEWSAFKDYVDWNGEWGFYLLNYLIKCVIGNNISIYLFLTSLVIIAPIVYFFYKNTGDAELCVLIYILSGAYVSGMNGVRQAFVAGVFIFSYKMIRNKRYVWYVLLCLVVSTIHTSALVLIPMIWILNMKAWRKGTYGMLGITFVLYIAYPLFAGVLTHMLAGSTYEGYSNGIQNFTNGGANVLRAVILLFPIIWSYVYSVRLEQRYELFGMVLNASVLNFMFMLLATVRSWIFARFCVYFNPFSILLLVWCIEVSGKNKKILYPACLGVYSIYFYYEMSTTIYAVF